MSMSRKKELTEANRAQIKILSEEGYSQQQIACRLKVSQSSVSKTLKRIKELSSFSSRSRTGRPRINSHQSDRFIHRFSTINPFASSSEIKANLPDEVRQPSTRTIRRRLANEFGLKAYKAAKKPLLTKKNLKDRRNFCAKYRFWSKLDWRKCLFSDETKVCQFSSNFPTVRRPPNKRFSAKYTVKKVRSSINAMVWGAISAQGPSKLYILPKNETINAPKYMELVKEQLPVAMATLNTNILQQDGAPCHSAKLIKTWFDNSPYKLLTPWPGNSPDLNPIENCWAVMKRKLSKLHVSSYEQLITKICDVWQAEITPEFCKNLVESMPKRIEACEENKGGITKY